jgi:hypothetical protein
LMHFGIGLLGLRCFDFRRFQGTHLNGSSVIWPTYNKGLNEKLT